MLVKYQLGRQTGNHRISWEAVFPYKAHCSDQSLGVSIIGFGRQLIPAEPLACQSLG